MNDEKITYVKGSFNCAETMIEAFNKRYNLEIPISIGSGMGLGMTTCSICGAVNASAVVIGFLKGRNSKDEANEARDLVNKLMKAVKEKYNSEICINLKNDKVECQEIIQFAYDETIKLLK
ncbi:MAG: C-GCAxxG-C-C family protein [Fusobacteriaceae bacterium]|jgi:C_GCAxxG_C_C family probable redox protein|nr:C-GCAxxG-C-C family protein [Fusobacteriaceae bacterium]MBP6322878.1 C-GCAxxG-C-C family protein [Fusobacteriaceae bacterium]MBP9509795.1 C-GCAxxG-C-C family protein [Fusobacteriaceae bacterium]